MKLAEITVSCLRVNKDHLIVYYLLQKQKDNSTFLSQSFFSILIPQNETLSQSQIQILKCNLIPLLVFKYFLNVQKLRYQCINTRVIQMYQCNTKFQKVRLLCFDFKVFLSVILTLHLLTNFASSQIVQRQLKRVIDSWFYLKTTKKHSCK